MKDNLIISLLVINIAFLIKINSDITKVNKKIDLKDQCSSNIGYATDNSYNVRWEE